MYAILFNFFHLLSICVCVGRRGEGDPRKAYIYILGLLKNMKSFTYISEQFTHTHTKKTINKSTTMCLALKTGLLKTDYKLEEKLRERYKDSLGGRERYFNNHCVISYFPHF